MTRLGEKKVRLTAVSAAIPGGGVLGSMLFFLLMQNLVVLIGVGSLVYV